MKSGNRKVVTIVKKEEANITFESLFKRLEELSKKRETNLKTLKEKIVLAHRDLDALQNELSHTVRTADTIEERKALSAKIDDAQKNISMLNEALEDEKKGINPVVSPEETLRFVHDIEAMMQPKIKDTTLQVMSIHQELFEIAKEAIENETNCKVLLTRWRTEVDPTMLDLPFLPSSMAYDAELTLPYRKALTSAIYSHGDIPESYDVQHYRIYLRNMGWE